MEFFKKHGVDLNRVVIGHVDLTGDADYVLKMLREGVYVEFDTIGKESYMPDRVRAEMLKKYRIKGISTKFYYLWILRENHISNIKVD